MGTHGSMDLADEQRAVRVVLQDLDMVRGEGEPDLVAVALVAGLHARGLAIADGPNAEVRLRAVLANASRVLDILDGLQLRSCLGCGRQRGHKRACPLSALRWYVDAPG